jgi:uncharacterized membrane protein YhhN
LSLPSAIVVTPAEVLAAVSLIAAAAYGFVLLQRPPSLLRTVTKTLAVAAIAVIAALTGLGWLLAIGFGLSAIGDAALEGDGARPNGPKRWLPIGLGCFLLAHAAYLVVFVHVGGGVLMFRAQPVRLAGVLAAVSAAIFMIRILWPYLGRIEGGALKGPVLVYVLAITAIVIAAFTLPLSRWPAMAGSAAFMASDAILAMRLFRYEGRPHRVADLAVWWLYYAAQVGIAAAFLSL